MDQLNWIDAGTVAAILIGLQVLKLIPPAKALQDWFSLAAVAIGVGTALLVGGAIGVVQPGRGDARGGMRRRKVSSSARSRCRG